MDMFIRFMKNLVVLVIFASLQGCSTVGSALGAAIEYASQAIDSSVANAISARNEQVSMRSNSLKDRPLTIAALKKACEKGRYVEVFLYQNTTLVGNEFKNSCVVVYASANAHLAQQEVLMQGFQLYTSGQYASVSRQQLEQEIAFRNYLRNSSYRIN